MSQKLVRAFLVAIVVLCGSSVAFAQEKAMPKAEKGKYAGIWAEDCTKKNGKWVDMVARWVEVYAAGKMVTNKEGNRVFKPIGKKLYRSTFDDIQSSGPGMWRSKTKSQRDDEPEDARRREDELRPQGSEFEYHYEFTGDLTLCK